MEEYTLIVKTSGAGRPPCADGPAVRWVPLTLVPLSPVREFPRRAEAALKAHPLIQEMVDGLTFTRAISALRTVVGWAASRYSFDTGCQTAVDRAYAAFSHTVLSVQLQTWSTEFPPNIVAELRGEFAPEDVFIVLAHLDDMPVTAPPPGANDNASGSALVLAFAGAMAPYRFAATVKFILVTGEEQGLLGSTYYAADAERRGENIIAVLNADGDPDFFTGACRTYLASMAHLAVPLGRRDGTGSHQRPMDRP